MDKHPRHDERLFRVLREGHLCGMPPREFNERIRALARSGSAAIDLWLGVFDAA